MAGEASTVGAGIALDAITGRATQTARTTYLAALTSAPTDTTTVGTMAEVTTAGYSRPSVTWSAPTGDPQTTANTNTPSFGTFTADPPNITHLALVSSASGTTGDFLYYWTLTTPRDGVSGDSAQVAPGALTMSLD
jgi:hypothetical protein